MTLPAGALAAEIEVLFATTYQQRMQRLARDAAQGSDKVRESRNFQIDLIYPAAKDAAKALDASSPTGAAAAAGAGVQAKPSFAELLGKSLQANTITRAWFDDTVGYSAVRQTRLPTKLPQVLSPPHPPTTPTTKFLHFCRSFRTCWWAAAESRHK